MRNVRPPQSDLTPADPTASLDEWDGLPSRINQVLAHSGLTQTDLARQLGISPGFLSEVARGIKRPGPDFFMGMRRLLAVSIDWLMTGEGTMTGGAGIRHELLQAIRLQIAVARQAIYEDDPTAKALLILIREGQLAGAMSDKHFGAMLERVAPFDSDLDLAVELYNGHLWTVDPIAQRRNLLAAAVAHFETRKPINKMASVTGLNSSAQSKQPHQPANVQLNFGQGQRNAGGDYYEHGTPAPRKKK